MRDNLRICPGEDLGVDNNGQRCNLLGGLDQGWSSETYWLYTSNNPKLLIYHDESISLGGKHISGHSTTLESDQWITIHRSPN